MFHIIVKGEVQGVGFRWFVQRSARDFKLAGWVRNLPGGNVEIEAEGHKDNLIKFAQSLRTGHSYARVDNIDIEEHLTAKNYKDFEISF